MVYPSADEILNELNSCRTNPSGYAKKIEALLPRFKGDVFSRSADCSVNTNEGTSAVHEAIRVLNSTPPLSSLKMENGLINAARDHSEDLNKSGGVSHTGSDGSTTQMRVERYGAWGGQLAENLTFGEISADSIIMSLIIDDGVPSRSHRSNALNPSFNLAGIVFGPHSVYKTSVVFVHTGEFREGAGGTIAPPPIASPFANVGYSSGLLVLDPKNLSAEGKTAIETIPIPEMRADIMTELSDPTCTKVELDLKQGSVVVKVFKRVGKSTTVEESEAQWG